MKHQHGKSGQILGEEGYITLYSEAQSKCCSHICVSISYSAKEATLDFKNYNNVVPNCKILPKQKQNRIKKFSCEKTADQFHNF